MDGQPLTTGQHIVFIDLDLHIPIQLPLLKDVLFSHLKPSKTLPWVFPIILTEMHTNDISEKVGHR